MSLQYLKQCMTSLDDVNTFAAKAWEEITNGEVEPLDLLSIKKFFDLYFDQLLKDGDISKSIDVEIDKYGDKEKCVHMGLKVTRASRLNYDFSECGDSEWSEHKLKIDFAKAALTNREAFLKALPSPMADTDTGEVINPPTVKRTDYYILK